jgi:RNA polymerase sigma-54 factor
MADLQHTLNHSQRQEQQMSGRQLQSLKLLEMALPDLETHLAGIVASNPVLEAEFPVEQPLPEPEPARLEKEDEADYESLAAAAEEWADELPVPGNYDPDAAERQEFWFNSLTGEVSLQDQLQKELELSDYPENIRDIASCIIDSLDDNGYLHSTLPDIAMVCNCEMSEAETALQLVQSFDPPGIGARDLVECLLLQLKRSGKHTPLLEKLLREYQEEIAKNQLPQLARKLGIPLEELSDNLKTLRSLSPYPVMGGSRNSGEVIVPELTIINRDGQYEVVPRREKMPRLYLSERYVKMLKEEHLSAEDRQYLEEKIRQAQELFAALELRESTMLRLGKMLVEHQRDFLESGPAALHPMTMKQAGELLDVHETTISRTAAGKYVQTPRGIFPLSYFFSAGFVSDEGEAVSNRAVMEKIKKLIEEENPAKPFSDAMLTDALAKQGLNVARRTVAKYREAMGIPSSSLRKKHF